jgi:2-amino-4-hydroxy-6-hydroxymethyldihydropteridine diphosphokinase
MARAYIALGSNLGDRAAVIAAALAALHAPPVLFVVAVSSNHETAPVGGPPGQGNYLNAAALIETTLTPDQLLIQLLSIEQQLGRVRTVKDAPRTIDLDLLLYDEAVLDSQSLTIPHPRMHQREFVLGPLCEIAPNAIHPILNISVRAMLSQVRGHMPPDVFLDGQRVLVTGSTGGIGRAIAEHMAQLGADVLIHGRRSVVAHDVAANIRSMGRRSAALLADLSQEPQVELLANQAWNYWSGLDVLVNNAGTDTLTGPAAEWSFAKKLQGLWEVDVRAAIQLSRWLGERMQQRGRGCIINIGWDQAETGMEGDSGQLFAVSKAAVMAFTKSLAKSLAPAVRVNCIAPGWIKTAWGETASPIWQERVRRETPLGRWGQPCDIAGAAGWLASPTANFITGQVIRVNGGVVM